MTREGEPTFELDGTDLLLFVELISPLLFFGLGKVLNRPLLESLGKITGLAVASHLGGNLLRSNHSKVDFP